MISDLNYFLHCNPNNAVHIRTMKFPGGEMGVNINTGSQVAFDVRAVTQIQLNARLNSSDAVMAMLMAADAIRRVYTNAQIDLFIPYFPYARQDRVCNQGESLSAKVMAQLINAFNFRSVWVVDPHSYVTVAALDRCVVLDQFDVFKDVKKGEWHKWTIVAPDQGALKKTEDFAKRVGAAGVISCTKHRELATGKITGMEVNGVYHGSLSDVRLLVLDDICDGGRTFVELAACLQRFEPETMELAVTHGIFSKGVQVLIDAGYKLIHTTDSFKHQDVAEDVNTILL